MGDADYKFKVILLGNIDVGKTSTILRFADGTFEEKIRGEIDQKSKDLVVDGKTARIIITDTAGQERFRTLTSSYYRNADAIVVTYDITNRESFEDVDGHIAEGTRYSQRSQKFIVANKLDLDAERVVSADEGDALAKKYGDVPFFETSAKTGQGIDTLFVSIARDLIASQAGSKSGGSEGFTLDESHKKESKKSFCIV